MGYLDEDFASHFWFAIKFVALLTVLRLITIYFGYTAPVPILDHIINFLARFADALFQLIASLFGGYAPKLV